MEDSEFPSNCPFAIGDDVDFLVLDRSKDRKVTCQGTIQWIGRLPGEECFRAGVIMTEKYQSYASSNGIFKGARYFRDGKSNKAVGRFVLLSDCTAPPPPSYNSIASSSTSGISLTSPCSSPPSSPPPPPTCPERTAQSNNNKVDYDQRRVHVTMIPSRYKNLCDLLTQNQETYQIDFWQNKYRASVFFRCRTIENASRLRARIFEEGGHAHLDMPLRLVVTSLPRYVDPDDFINFIAKIHPWPVKFSGGDGPVFIKARNCEEARELGAAILSQKLPLKIGPHKIPHSLKVRPDYVNLKSVPSQNI